MNIYAQRYWREIQTKNSVFGHWNQKLESNLICGYCGGEIDDQHTSTDSDHCLCGRRAIVRVPAGILTHAEGCVGGDQCICGVKKVLNTGGNYGKNTYDGASRH